jgi:hypothetical protein
MSFPVQTQYFPDLSHRLPPVWQNPTPRIRFSYGFSDLMSDPFDCQRRFAKQGWAVSTGIAGQFQSEMLGSFNRNHWAVCAGIGGQFRPESLGSLGRNMRLPSSFLKPA